MFFAGACVTLFLVPLLADKYWGRKFTLIVIAVLCIIGQLGLLICTNIYWAYTFIFILGMCFSGRVFLALTFTIEFLPVRFYYTVPFVYLLSEPIFLLGLTIWY